MERGAPAGAEQAWSSRPVTRGPTRSWGCSCAPKATTGLKGRSSTRSSARRCDAAGAKRDDQPVLTELSVSDYAKLVDAGIEPLGIVAWTSVFFAVYANNWVMQPNRMNPAKATS